MSAQRHGSDEYQCARLGVWALVRKGSSRRGSVCGRALKGRSSDGCGSGPLGWLGSPMSPVSSTRLTRGDVRKTWKGKPDTAKALLAIMKAGWEIHREGKHYRAYCPCGDADFSVAGSPGRDSVQANKIRGNASKCPGKHDVLRLRKRQGSD